MDMQLREQYIKAYQFYYGGSRKKALESFKQRIDSGEQDTIVLLIDLFIMIKSGSQDYVLCNDIKDY